MAKKNDPLRPHRPWLVARVGEGGYAWPPCCSRSSFFYTVTASLATSLLAAMSAQQLELAVLYAYNPPGVGEEAAGVKAQVCACEALHYGYRQIS